MFRFSLKSIAKVMACVAGLMAVQSFAQPRDLFAEFEAEEQAAEEKAAAEKKAAEEKAAAEKQAAEEQAAAEKKAADEKAAAEKQVAEDKKAAEKAAKEQAAAEKKAEAERIAEEKRLAKEKAAEEKKRLAEEKKAEAARIAEEKRLAKEKAAEEKKRLAEEKKAEAARIAEEKRLAKEQAAEEKKRQAEEKKRLAEEKKAAEEKQKKEAERDAYERATMSPEAYEKLQQERREQAVNDSLAEIAAAKAAEERRAAMEQARIYAEQDSAARANAAAAAAENKNVDVNEEYARAMQAYADSARAREDLEAIARDSAAVAQMIADSIAAAQADSIKAAEALAAANSSSSVSVIPSSSSMSRRDLLGPVKVSKVNGIDEMKGRYRSPRKAMFMSLVIPGSGQLYIGGSSFTNIRGGAYLALEVALWSGWYYFSVYKYDEQVKKYKDFAKDHYSIGRYERKMRDLYDQDAVNYESEFRARYLGNRETFCEGIFGKATMHGCYDKSNLYHNDVEYENDFVKNPVSLGEELDKISFDNASEVYQLLADRAMVLGWDDIENEALATGLGLEDPESETVTLGFSSNMKKYRSMRGKATDYADMQAWFFGGIILNHIVSAVDAAFTASSYNKALYQEDLSWYDRLHFDSGVQFFGGFGVNVQASWGF